MKDLTATDIKHYEARLKALSKDEANIMQMYFTSDAETKKTLNTALMLVRLDIMALYEKLNINVYPYKRRGPVVRLTVEDEKRIYEAWKQGDKTQLEIGKDNDIGQGRVSGIVRKWLALERKQK